MTKKIYKFTMILCISVLFLNMIANTIYAAIEVDLNKVYLEKIGQADYHLKYYNASKNTEVYVKCSIVGYNDKNGFNPAYCMNKNLDGAEKAPYYVTTEKILNNNQVWRVIRNGYPFKSYKQMGLSSEFNAYTVTKMAIYCILGESLLENFRADNKDKEAVAMLSELKKLVNIGINGKETQNTDPISIEKLGNLKKENENWVQEYKINSNVNYSEYQILQESNIPEGCYIINTKGEETKKFKSGENFKIIIPNNKLIKDLEFNIRISAQCSVYLILEGQTTVANTQNYVVTTGENKSTKFETNLKINGDASNINILKICKDNKNPIKGISFGLYNQENELIATKQTDDKGKLKFQNLYPGKYKVIELETDEKYILDKTPIEVELQYDETKDLVITNELKKGQIKLVKIDEDNKEIKIEGAKFELYDSSNKKVGEYTTNKDGEINIKDLPIGVYTIKETATNKWYNLEDKQTKIEVTQNETIKVEMTNSLKKGQIKVIKKDKDDNKIKLEGVKFDLIDKNGNKLETLITDKNGEALTSKYSLKNYETLYLKEIETDANYVLNEKAVEVKLEANKIKEITFENEKIKGKIKIIKTSKDDNKINSKKAGAPLEGVKFQIINSQGKIIENITTNKEGIATSSDLEKGEYKIKEIETDKDYILNQETKKVKIEKNQETICVEIKNESKNPELDIEKNGPDSANIGEKIEYDISIRNTGNTHLENFTMTDYIPSEYVLVNKITTGTYNQDIRYNLYYKTNLADEYILLMEELNSKENYEIDFSEELADNEYITEIKLEFKTVDVGFSSNENPHIYGIVRNTVKSEDVFTNIADISGKYNDYNVYDKSKWKTIALKLLPKTGF